MNIEVRANPKSITDASKRIPGIMVCPVDKIGKDDYWTFRVDLSANQSLVAFPKFGTIGIGFLKESDWNTNLPWQSGAGQIWNHIKHNKGDDSVSDEDCQKAIEMLCSACEQYANP